MIYQAEVLDGDLHYSIEPFVAADKAEAWVLAECAAQDITNNFSDSAELIIKPENGTAEKRPLKKK